MKEPLIKANRVFKYSITFQETNDESREISDFSDSGFIIENETDEIGDILKLAQQTYGIYYPISFGGWESTTPEHNAKYFEKGIETYYALFVENEDGTDITEEEYDFITFLLSDGNYNKSEFTDYAVGGVVLGALALGVGGLIAYYYFNKQVPARNRKYDNGGGLGNYEMFDEQLYLDSDLKDAILENDTLYTFIKERHFIRDKNGKLFMWIDWMDYDQFDKLANFLGYKYVNGGGVGQKIYLENPYNENGGFIVGIAKDNISEIMNHVSFRKFGNEFRKHIDSYFTQENNIERVNKGISWSELASYIVGDGDYDVEQEQYENFIKSFNTTYTKNEYKGGGGVEIYDTDSFETKIIAEKNQEEIKDYFGERLLESEIVNGIDDKGNYGYQVKYKLKKQNKFDNGGGVKKSQYYIILKQGLTITNELDSDTFKTGIQYSDWGITAEQYEKLKNGETITIKGGNVSWDWKFKVTRDMVERIREIKTNDVEFDNGGDVREMDWYKGFKKTRPFEMVVVTKEAEKDGGNEIIFNVIVEAQNDTLAYQEARKKWQMENGLSDLSIVKVYTKEEYVNSKKMNNGGGVDDKGFNVVVKLPKGLITKKDFDGFSKQEIIDWCEKRGWKYNENGEKLGGRVLNNYEFYLKPIMTYNKTLPKNKFDNGGGVEYKYTPYAFVYREIDDPDFLPERLSPEEVKEFIENFNEDFDTNYKDWQEFNKGEEYRKFEAIMLRERKFNNGGTTTRPTTTPEVVPDTTPTTPKTPFKPKHIPKPKARKYDFILIKK